MISSTFKNLKLPASHLLVGKNHVLLVTIKNIVLLLKFIRELISSYIS